MGSSFFRSMLSIDATESMVRLPDAASPTLLKIIGVLRTGECQAERSNKLDVATLRICEKYDLLFVGRAILERTIPRLGPLDLQEALCWASKVDSAHAGHLILLKGHATTAINIANCPTLNPFEFPKAVEQRFRPSWMYALFKAAHQVPLSHGTLDSALKAWDAWLCYASAFSKLLSEYVHPPGSA